VPELNVLCPKSSARQGKSVLKTATAWNSFVIVNIILLGVNATVGWPK